MFLFYSAVHIKRRCLCPPLFVVLLVLGIVLFPPYILAAGNGSTTAIVWKRFGRVMWDTHSLSQKNESLIHSTGNTANTANAILNTMSAPSLLPSQDAFTQAIMACGFPAPSEPTYTAFSNAVSPLTSTRELAMFLAQTLHESDGLRALREYACISTGCPGQYATPGLDIPGKHYYGRGYIQLSWAYNYRDASQSIFSDPAILLQHPDRVAESHDMAWATAVWFWMHRGVHEQAQTGYFGLTTNIINGGLECHGGWNQGAARKRFALYHTIATLWHIPPQDILESGCY